MLDQIQKLVTDTVTKKYKTTIEVETQYADPERGDFTTNAAFKLAAELKKSPKTIALELAKSIKSKDIASTSAVGGYVNLKMTEEFWLRQLGKVDSNYGSSKIGEGQKVQVEFISANPTGPLTLGNARGGFVGDVLASVLAKTGHEVTKEYYFNDAGTQISKLIDSVRIAAGVEEGEQTYNGEYINELAEEFKDHLGEDNAKLGQLLTQEIFKRHIKDAISKMGIKFDVWFNERTIIESGQFQGVLARLKREKLVYEKEGATWLDSLELGDDRDRVLVKSNGDNTYLANDIPYHVDIFENRGFDRAIKILGADHVGQIASLMYTLQRLLPDKKLENVIVQWVRLVKDGQEVKMSKRAGTYITVEELIDEVGADVARFFFLIRSTDAQMEFDLGLAKEQSQKNPLWYVMYSFARAHSILGQAKKKGLSASSKSQVSSLKSADLELIKYMARWPELLGQISVDFGVHKLTFYGQELARLFHEFYESERIIDLDAKAAGQKLYLIEQFIVLMDSYWSVLGIKPLKKM